MSWKISDDKMQLLKELGFGRVPDCDPSFAFHAPVVAYNTNMMVRGDHADDCAYIYYACIEIDGEVLDGFFYAPSILEHPLLNYQKWDVNEVLQELENHAGCFVRELSVGGIPMLFVEIDEYNWKLKDLRFPFSDMLKVVGSTDYLFSRAFNLMREQENNN